jgi:hypothetical protein
MTSVPPGPPPSGPPPSGAPAAPPPAGGPPPGERRGLSTNQILALVLALVVAVGGIIALVVVNSGGDDSSDDSATSTSRAEREIFTEPVSFQQENPFSPPVGEGDADVDPVEPTGSQQTQSGGQPGLYGGTMREGSCDKAQLVTYLQQNPSKGRAWASTLGIQYADISTYVDTLTAVTLRSDTRITNHGYSNGVATEIQVVLQAGTAVLVDQYGFPVTKCYCGNPLTAPKEYPKVYYGPKWPAFTPQSITVVIKTTVIIDTFVLIDSNTGDAFTRPRGSDGGQDAPTTPPSTTPPTTRPGTSTTLPSQSVPPQTSPPTQPGPTAEQRAIAKVQQGASACYPFPAPIEDSTSTSFSTENESPSTFVLTATTNSASNQSFVWAVDRATLAFTPLNDLAGVASNHCSILN